ncbi:MAG: hypothetical protein WC662_04615 [Candidatus Paceibacterota bacterium]|jgi:hypothetical protein
MKYFTNLFLKIESKARSYFEHFPFLHAFLAGVGVILFWRGVWEVADAWGIHYWWSILLGGVLLIVIGLFVHTFIGNAIIIKNVESEKRIDLKTKTDIEKVEKEMVEEEITLSHLAKKLESIEAKLESLSKK